MALNIELDQFYTDKAEVEKCIEAIAHHGIDLNTFDMVLEPSAGTGAFFLKLPEHNRVGLDLDPKCEGVIKQDFFHYSPYNLFSADSRKIITVGNPPYGRAGNLAVKFINQSAEWSDYVCMILPRSFKKYSLQNRVNLNLHLIHQHDVNDFVLPDGTLHKVYSVFQIWEKRPYNRNKIQKRKVTDLWDWTTPDKADCAMIFFGTPTGLLKTDDLTNLTKTTHSFMKSKIPLEELIELFVMSAEEIKSTYKGSNTAAGSLAKGDVIEILEKNYELKRSTGAIARH